MKTYNHITTIEIDEVYKAVSIDFKSDGRTEVEILKITDLDNGDAIAPDLNGQMTKIGEVCLYDDLLGFAADMQADRLANGMYSFAL